MAGKSLYLKGTRRAATAPPSILANLPLLDARTVALRPVSPACARARSSSPAHQKSVVETNSASNRETNHVL